MNKNILFIFFLFCTHNLLAKVVIDEENIFDDSKSQIIIDTKEVLEEPKEDQNTSNDPLKNIDPYSKKILENVDPQLDLNDWKKNH